MDGHCASCASPIFLESINQWRANLITFFLVVAVAAVTYRRDAGGTWLLIPILLILPIKTLASIFFCEYRVVTRRPPVRIPFIVFFFTAVLMSFAYVFVALGWLSFLLGSRRDLIEQLQGLSFPLGQLWPRFLISPQVSFADVLGVVFANSLFWGLVLLVCFRVAQAGLRRGRVQQIGLSGDVDQDEDEV